MSPHPTAPTDMGMNRTGVATSPIDSKALVDAAQQTGNGGPPENPLLGIRVEFSRTSGPVGTMPPPASLKGVAKAGMQMMKGHAPTVFLDKLGERLAYERTGVRLYEALIAKLDAAERDDKPELRARIEVIRDEELMHMQWVRQAIEELGADPTVMTPCADVVGTASLGFVQALSDGRTTFTQALDVILGVELLDNDSWQVLILLAEQMGRQKMAEQFRTALSHESQHLKDVRAWATTTLLSQVETPARSSPQPRPPSV